MFLVKTTLVLFFVSLNIVIDEFFFENKSLEDSLIFHKGIIGEVILIKERNMNKKIFIIFNHFAFYRNYKKE